MLRHSQAFRSQQCSARLASGSCTRGRVDALATILLLGLGVSLGCGKEKKTEPPSAPAVASSSVAVASVKAPIPSASAVATSSALPSASAAPPPGKTIDGEFVLASELFLPEGKALTPPKFEKAGLKSEARVAHDEKLKEVHESMLSTQCRSRGNFSVTYIPTTYMLCLIEGREETPKSVGRDYELRLHEIEGVAWNTITLATSKEPIVEPAYALMLTDRGFFFDLFGDGSLTYAMVRTHTLEGIRKTECKGKSWDKTDTPIVTNADMPLFPSRGRDVDDDGKNDFPYPMLEVPLTGVYEDESVGLDGTCGTTDSVSVAVLGVGAYRERKWSNDGAGYRSFYERRLTNAKARINKLRAALSLSKLENAAETAENKPEPVARKRALSKKTDLIMTNTCALDMAQAIVQLGAYQLVLGVSKEKVLEEFDALSKGFTLNLADCKGIKAEPFDRWAKLRVALNEMVPPKVGDAPAAPSAGSAGSASAAPH